jgi:hypothetical protein
MDAYFPNESESPNDAFGNQEPSVSRAVPRVTDQTETQMTDTSSSVVAQSNFVLNLLEKIPDTQGFHHVTPDTGTRGVFGSTFVAKALQTIRPGTHRNPYLPHELMSEVRNLLVSSPRVHEEKNALRCAMDNEPACCNRQCCVKFIPGYVNDVKYRMIAYFTAAEWAAYETSMVKYRANGGVEPALPTQPRLCLLCLRKNVASVVIGLQNDNCQFPTTIQQKPLLVERLENLVDIPGEYPAEYCVQPFTSTKTTFYNGVPSHIALPLFTRMSFVVSSNGQIRVNQNIPAVDAAPPDHTTRF